MNYNTNNINIPQISISDVNLNDSTNNNFDSYREATTPTGPPSPNMMPHSPILQRPVSPFSMSPAAQHAPSSPIPVDFNLLKLTNDGGESLFTPATAQTTWNPFTFPSNTNTNSGYLSISNIENGHNRRKSTSDIAVSNYFNSMDSMIPNNNSGSISSQIHDPSNGLSPLPLSRSHEDIHAFPSIALGSDTNPHPFSHRNSASSLHSNGSGGGNNTTNTGEMDFDVELLLSSYPEFNINSIPVSPKPAETQLKIPAHSELLQPLDGGPVRRRKSRSGSTSPGGPSSAEAEKQHTCPIPGCGKTFSRRGNMVAHVKTHDSNRERNYVCQICQKAFCRPHDLQRHSTVHTGIKAFACPACGKSFTRRDAIRRHGGLSGCYNKAPHLFEQ